MILLRDKFNLDVMRPIPGIVRKFQPVSYTLRSLIPFVGIIEKISVNTSLNLLFYLKRPNLIVIINSAKNSYNRARNFFSLFSYRNSELTFDL